MTEILELPRISFCCWGKTKTIVLKYIQSNFHRYLTHGNFWQTLWEKREQYIFVSTRDGDPMLVTNNWLEKLIVSSFCFVQFFHESNCHNLGMPFALFQRSLTYNGYFVPKKAEGAEAEGILTLRGSIDGDITQSTLTVAVIPTTESQLEGLATSLKDSLDGRRSLISPLVKK